MQANLSSTPVPSDLLVDDGHALLTAEPSLQDYRCRGHKFDAEAALAVLDPGSRNAMARMAAMPRERGGAGRRE